MSRSRSLLLFLLLAQRRHATSRERQGPPGFFGLGVAAFTLRTPDVDREPVFARPGRIESTAADRLPSGRIIHPGDHVVPAQRPGLFGADADQQAQHNVRVQARTL
jgi:hypothetical protein